MLLAIADFYAAVHRGLSLTVKTGVGAEVLDSIVTSAMAAWGASGSTEGRAIIIGRRGSSSLRAEAPSGTST